jgi:predicted MFS family arabinose efflux permease
VRAAAGGVLLGLATGWNFTNVGAVADALADDYATALAVVGVFTTVFWLTHATMQLPGGRFSDRLGPQPVGLAALGLMLAGNGLALVAAEPGAAIAGRALVGLGTGLGFLAGSDYMRLSGGGAFAQGIFGGSAMAGGGIALATVPALYDALGWRAPFASAVALAAVGLVVLAAAPRRRSPGLHRDAGRLPELARDPRLLRLSVVHMASLGLYAVVFAWIVTLLERAGGYSNETAGAATAAALIAGIVGRPAGGWLVRRRPERAPAVMAASLAGGAIGTLMLVPAGPLALVLAATTLIGLAAGVGFAPVFGEAARLRPDAPGAAVGWVNTLGNSIAVIGTPLLGLAFSLPGDGRVGFVAAAVLWAAPLLVLVWPARREERRAHGSVSIRDAEPAE